MTLADGDTTFAGLGQAFCNGDATLLRGEATRPAAAGAGLPHASAAGVAALLGAFALPLFEATGLDQGSPAAAGVAALLIGGSSALKDAGGLGSTVGEATS